MQISARCVLPVTSIRRLRKIRSTSQGGQSAPPGSGICSERDLQLVELVVAGLVERGAWLVGPMNRPENR